MKLLFSEYTTAAENLAYEEFLFNTCEEELLLLYINQPSVIIGSNQVVENEVNVDFCLEKNISIFRRLSGGGAVYHDTGNVNFSFILQRNANNSALTDAFLRPVVETLHTMEIPVVVGKRKDLWLPGEYKVSGTASHVTRLHELHHGTLLFDANIEYLTKSLNPVTKNTSKKGTASVQSRVKNIKQFLLEKGIEMTNEKFIDKFKHTLELYFSTEFQSDILKNDIEMLVKSKYKTEAWNFKK